MFKKSSLNIGLAIVILTHVPMHGIATGDIPALQELRDRQSLIQWQQAQDTDREWSHIERESWRFAAQTQDPIIRQGEYHHALNMRRLEYVVLVCATAFVLYQLMTAGPSKS